MHRMYRRHAHQSQSGGLAMALSVRSVKMSNFTNVSVHGFAAISLYFIDLFIYLFSYLASRGRTFSIPVPVPKSRYRQIQL